MAYYIIADTRFSLEDYVKERQFADRAEMDSVLIDKWNSVVGEKDTVWVFGEFGGLDVLKKLNGTVHLMNPACNPNFKDQDIKDAGGAGFLNIGVEWDMDFNPEYQEEAPPKDKNQMILFPAGESLLEQDGFKHWAVDSRWDEGQVFHDGKLSLRADFWDYTPIAASELTEIYKRMDGYDTIAEGGKENES